MKLPVKTSNQRKRNYRIYNSLCEEQLAQQITIIETTANMVKGLSAGIS